MEEKQQKHPLFSRLLKKHTCLLPTPLGWFLLSLMLLIFIGSGISLLHPFLAVTRPIGAGALIIEGWVPDYCYDSAVVYFNRGDYRKIFVTGGPVESGSRLLEFGNYAVLGSRTLAKCGVPDSLVTAVPAPHSRIDRTWGSAVAFKQWLDSAGLPVTTFDLLSQSTHTRRSTLFFRRALGKKYRVGSVAIADPDYDPRRWWTSSKGFRQTVDESIAYIYALFFIFSH